MGTGAGPAGALTAGSPATGQINTVGGSSLADGETFMISDGANSPTVFEFDSNASVASGHVAVPFTAATSADGVKVAVINAVNGVGAGLSVTASNGGSGLVALVNDNIGSAGNQPILENVANPGFTVSGMGGGSAPPVLATIGNRSVDEGAQLQFTISATDPDGDPLIYSATNLPSGATFDSATRTFTWTPGFNQAGSFPNVHFQVSDGSLTDSEDIAITVNDVDVDVDVDTTIVKGPKDRSSRSAAKFKFVSSEAGSTFECKLEGKDVKGKLKRFGACTSPKRYKHLAPGRYRFEVRAIDGAGSADPTPAEDEFKVTR
jgi:hypothetical protein